MTKNAMTTCGNILDTDHNCCEDHYQRCCSVHMVLPCDMLLRVVEFGFHLVVEDDGWADDEDHCNQQRRRIQSKYQPPTTQEYLQIKQMMYVSNSYSPNLVVLKYAHASRILLLV
jgi:hypothetical protein